MKQAHNKWSPLYKKAIEDFTTSISLESSSVNANSFITWENLKKSQEGKKTGCTDFVVTDRGLELGCERYDVLCYPKTGYMLYKKLFGEGVHSGNNTLSFDNKTGKTDVLIL